MSAIQKLIRFAKDFDDEETSGLGDAADTELAAQAARIEKLEAALAKSDPWNVDGEQNYVFVCRHCGEEYGVMKGEAPKQHKPDCIWLAAVLKGGS